MDNFLKNTHGFATGGLYSPPEPCEACFTMDAHTLFDVLWTVEEKHPTHCNDNAWNSQDNFYITLIGFSLKEESHI